MAGCGEVRGAKVLLHEDADWPSVELKAAALSFSTVVQKVCIAAWYKPFILRADFCRFRVVHHYCL
jgi:hypothetical protein